MSTRHATTWTATTESAATMGRNMQLVEGKAGGRQLWAWPSGTCASTWH